MHLNLGKGCFFHSDDEKDTLHNALMLSPFKLKHGTCMFQNWILGFNPNNPSNLAFLAWVPFRDLPYEHIDQACAIVETLRKVIGIDTSNETTRDPQFCINLMVSQESATNIAIETKVALYHTTKLW